MKAKQFLPSVSGWKWAETLYWNMFSVYVHSAHTSSPRKRKTVYTLHPQRTFLLPQRKLPSHSRISIYLQRHTNSRWRYVHRYTYAFSEKKRRRRRKEAKKPIPSRWKRKGKVEKGIRIIMIIIWKWGNETKYLQIIRWIGMKWNENEDEDDNNAGRQGVVTHIITCTTRTLHPTRPRTLFSPGSTFE